MATEYNDRSMLVKLLKSLDAIPVENPARPGTPDVNYLHGWIELKRLPHWPKRGGPLRVPHFSPQQKIRHVKRCQAGGNSFVLVRVGDDWLLMDGEVASIVLGKSKKRELIHHSIFYWQGSLDGDELLQYLESTTCRM